MKKIYDIQAHHTHTIISYWPQWSGCAAATWSLLYSLLGIYWELGGAGFPFGAQSDPPAQVESILGGVRVGIGSPTIAGLGILGTLIALAMTRPKGNRITRLVLLTFAWLIAVALLIVIPDRRVLMAVAYAPVFLVGAPFHWPPVSFLNAIPWPVLNQLLLMGGGVLWVATALSYQRRTRGSCAHCGRSAAQWRWANPVAASQWGRWAVGIAVIVPLLYATTRCAWALGIPLGISEEFLHAGQADGLWIAGACLAMVAIGGALLTLGLVQRWGEIFPRWMVGLAGKRVPPLLAIIPASFVSFIVTSAGLAYARAIITQVNTGNESSWTTMGPEALWPIWGLALATATLAYYYRRRNRCQHCGQA